MKELTSPLIFQGRQGAKEGKDRRQESKGCTIKVEVETYPETAESSSTRWRQAISALKCSNNLILRGK